MKKVIESLFHSESFFWLTTAVATGFAAEEMEQFCADVQGNVHTEEIVALFHQCVRNNEITDAEMQKAKQWSLDNLRIIDNGTDRRQCFTNRKVSASVKALPHTG